jgi:hypothetical protein
MGRDPHGPDHDRLIVAELNGAARQHAGWHDLTEAETAAAVAELREIAGDRADLLAEVAGILIGASEGQPDEQKSKGAAQLCIAAGADQDRIPNWVEEGWRRSAAARKVPHSGRRAIDAQPRSRPGRTEP